MRSVVFLCLMVCFSCKSRENLYRESVLEVLRMQQQNIRSREVDQRDSLAGQNFILSENKEGKAEDCAEFEFTLYDTSLPADSITGKPPVKLEGRVRNVSRKEGKVETDVAGEEVTAVSVSGEKELRDSSSLQYQEEGKEVLKQKKSWYRIWWLLLGAGVLFCIYKQKLISSLWKRL